MYDIISNQLEQLPKKALLGWRKAHATDQELIDAIDQEAARANGREKPQRTKEGRKVEGDKAAKRHADETRNLTIKELKMHLAAAPMNRRDHPMIAAFIEAEGERREKELREDDEAERKEREDAKEKEREERNEKREKEAKADEAQLTRQAQEHYLSSKDEQHKSASITKPDPRPAEGATN